MNAVEEKPAVDFYRYPSIGVEDWSYAYATALVRTLETNLLSHGLLTDMASAADFQNAADLLSSSEYSISSDIKNMSDVEKMLMERRTAAREMFLDLMNDERVVELLRAREDFANMRLAVRRVVTDKPLGLDYSNEGSVSAEEFEEIFEQENYSRFPDYLQDAVEEAVLGYYENKDIRRIDYGIDKAAAAFRIKRAKEIESEFCLSYFRIQIDLTNIRTMLRLKMAERDERNLFIAGGFIENDRLVHGLDLGYEAIGPLFFATPYFEVVEKGISYLNANESFLGLERACEEYMMGFFQTTNSIASGPQPVIAYFLKKETEIRNVRMLLTGKMNQLEPKLMTDRLAEA